MLSSSRARRRSDSVRGLMPAHECSSCEKRRGPSERSWTRSAVHFAPMISAHAATAQEVDSWTGFIVRMAIPIVVNLEDALGRAAEKEPVARLVRAGEPRPPGGAPDPVPRPRAPIGQLR